MSPHSYVPVRTSPLHDQSVKLTALHFQDDWDSDFDDDHSPGPGQVGGAQGGGTAGHTLSLPPGTNYQARGSTGDVSSVGE